jgi:hypothetical protein
MVLPILQFAVGAGNAPAIWAKKSNDYGADKRDRWIRSKNRMEPSAWFTDDAKNRTWGGLKKGPAVSHQC